MNKQEQDCVVNYLNKFGYTESDTSITECKKGTKKLQKNLGLKPTGVIDEKLLKAIQAPRCGVPDTVRSMDARAKWNKQEVTWTYKRHLDEFTSAEFKEILEQCFADWMKHIKLRLKYTTGTADITISTAKGRNNGFDGVNGILAWAELPSGNDGPLRIFFDEDETWLQLVDKGSRGIYTQNVGEHEIGHTLGLDHDKLKDQLLAAYYNPNIWEPKSNDIKRSQAIYGPANVIPPPVTPSDLNIKVVGKIDKIEIPGFRITKIYG